MQNMRQVQFYLNFLNIRVNDYDSHIKMCQDIFISIFFVIQTKRRMHPNNQELKMSKLKECASNTLINVSQSTHFLTLLQGIYTLRSDKAMDVQMFSCYARGYKWLP